MQHLPYSKIIRFFREEQKLTLRQLSDLTFFGFQTLSKYETELIPLSDENFEVVAKALGIDYSLILYINHVLKQDLDHLYECIVYDYENEMEVLINRIKKSYIYVKHSDLYHYYLVLMFAIDIIFGKEPEHIHEILNIKDQIDSNILQIFYDYYAIYVSRLGHLSDSIDILDRAINLGKRPLISAMLHYHAGLLNSIHGNLKTSLSHNLEAEHLFIQEHNHIRLISVQTNIATIYARQKSLDKALEIYNRLLKEAIRSKNEDIEIVTRYNIAWCYKLMKRYEDSNLIIENIEQVSSLTTNGYYIKACNYFDLNETEKAQVIIDHNLNQELDPLFKLKFQILDFENKNQQNDDYCNCLKDFLSQTQASYDYENTEFVLDKLIDYFELKHSYKCANQYLKDKIQLIERKFSK